MLEALGTEKNSLVFQLERLEQQLKSLQGGQNSSSHINMAAMEGPGQCTAGWEIPEELILWDFFIFILLNQVIIINYN